MPLASLGAYQFHPICTALCVLRHIAVLHTLPHRSLDYSCFLDVTHRITIPHCSEEHAQIVRCQFGLPPESPENMLFAILSVDDRVCLLHKFLFKSLCSQVINASMVNYLHTSFHSLNELLKPCNIKGRIAKHPNEVKTKSAIFFSDFRELPQLLLYYPCPFSLHVYLPGCQTFLPSMLMALDYPTINPSFRQSITYSGSQSSDTGCLASCSWSWIHGSQGFHPMFYIKRAKRVFVYTDLGWRQIQIRTISRYIDHS